MSFYFVFEKRISQSVRIVYLRKTRIAINNSSIITQVSDLNCTFAPSEGRNPWIKNAFLAFIRKIEIWKISKTEDRNNVTLILFAYMQAVYSPSKAVHTFPIYATAWGICFSVHFCYGFPEPDFR